MGERSDNYSLIDEATDKSSTINFEGHERQPVSYLSQQDGDSWKDTESNLAAMDRCWDSHFSEWIRDERNALLIGQQLARILSDYPLDRIVHGLRWIFIDWRLASIVALLGPFLFGDSIGGVLSEQLDLLMAISHDWHELHRAELIYLLYRERLAEDPTLETELANLLSLRAANIFLLLELVLFPTFRSSTPQRNSMACCRPDMVKAPIHLSTESLSSPPSRRSDLNSASVVTATNINGTNSSLPGHFSSEFTIVRPETPIS